MVRLNLAAIVACLSAQDDRPIGKRAGSSIRSTGERRPKSVSARDRAHVAGHEGNVTRVVRLLLCPPARRPVRDGPVVPSRDALLSSQRAQGTALGCRFVESRVALLSNLYSKRNSSNTPPARASNGVVSVGESRLRSSSDVMPPTSMAETTSGPSGPGVQSPAAKELVFPAVLDAALHDGARRIVQRAQLELQQPLLDELAGHLASKHKAIENPLGWLHSITAKAVNGDLVLTLAAGIASARECRARHEAALAGLAPSGMPAQRSTEDGEASATSTAADAAAARARLRELRALLASRTVGDSSKSRTGDVTHAAPPLSQSRTTPNGCALSQTGTTDLMVESDPHGANKD